ncbi:type II secretion system protein GspL [Pseudodesulfovibrio tunisiensis]|uniref:type II secretion system protein GspL n=1 Tax=Pseudodesulfovibrio tunisiensis TaxID=463192 RepID=UPI001FB3CFDD|nr:type II secretion system protein GspL [Pseudodesulfovibrio tunisiensis]
MRNRIAHIALTDGKLHFLLRSDRQAPLLQLAMSVSSDAEGLAAALAHARDNGADFDRAVVAVDGRDCILRNYRMPIRGRRQLEQAVDFELDEDLPLDAEDLVRDHFCGLHQDGISHVVAAAVKRERIAELVAMFDAQDVEIERMDVDAAAFARACLAVADGRARLGGLEIGRDRTLFCLLDQGRVACLSVLPWGESLLARDVARDHGMAEEEADRLLVFGEDASNGSTAAEQEDRVAARVTGFVQRLLRETYRILGDREWPSSFMLSGDVVRVQGFRRIFEAEAETGVEVWEETVLALGEETDEGQRGSGLAVGYGVAEESGPGFDFRKGEFALAHAAGIWGREAAHLAVLGIVVALAWAGYAYASLVSGQREIVYLREAMTEVYREALPNVSADLSSVQYQSILSSKVNLLAGEGQVGRDGVGTPVIETLRIVSSVLDRKIDVEFLSLSLDGKSIALQGETRSMNEVDAIRAALVRTGAFSEVKVKNAVADKKSRKIRFEIGVLR